MGCGWRIPNRAAKLPDRTRVRSFGPEQPGPNPCCAFHAGSLRDGARGAARSVDTHGDLRSCLGDCGAHTPSRRHRRLIEPSTVRLPAIRTDTRPYTARSRARVRRTPLQARMSAMTIVVTLELKELQFQIGGRPKECAIQAFPANRANQPFNEGMRTRRVRHRLDGFHIDRLDARVVNMSRLQASRDVAARGLAPSVEALDTPLGRRDSRHAPGVCYSALRRLPRRDLHPLEKNDGMRTLAGPHRHDAPWPPS